MDAAKEWVEDLLMTLPHGISPETTVLSMHHITANLRKPYLASLDLSFNVLGLLTMLKSFVKNEMDVRNVILPAILVKSTVPYAKLQIAIAQTAVNMHKVFSLLSSMVIEDMKAGLRMLCMLS